MKRFSWIVLFAAIAALIAVVITRPTSCQRTLKDGSVMVLSDLRITTTNTYIHGTLLQKTLGRLLPDKRSIPVGKFTLSAPERLTFRSPSNSLFMQFHLLPGSPGEASFLNPPFFRSRRIILSGDDGFPYVTEIISGYGPNYYDGCFKKYADGVFDAFEKWTYPRDSKTFHFRLEERASRDSDDWHELATFDLPNPHPIKPEHRDVDKSPRFKFPPDIEIEIGDLVVRNSPNPFHDIWNPHAYLSARITRGGHVVTNWGISDATFTDALGNRERIFMKTVTNDWTTFSTHRPLDPSTPWHFKMDFGEDSDFPKTNLYTFTTRLPINGIISTNFGPFHANLSTPGGDYLSVSLVDPTNDVALKLVSAVNAKGWPHSNGSGSWSQQGFTTSMRYWRSPDGIGHSEETDQVTATISIHPAYRTEFTLQPRYEK